MWQRRERENDSGERVLFATLVPEWGCEAYAEGCSDNSSIMRTVEHSMTNAASVVLPKRGHQDPPGKAIGSSGTWRAFSFSSQESSWREENRDNNVSRARPVGH
jgi:hypothetical protein